MPSRTLVPTRFRADGAWTDGANALGWSVDGYGARSDGTGWLALFAMAGRELVPVQDAVVGFEAQIRARGQGGGEPCVVTALYDLGAPASVGRFTSTVRTVNAGQSGLLQASNDGETWIAVPLSPSQPAPLGGGWIAHDVSCAAGAFRYWRTWASDPGPGADARIGDFRLYVGGEAAAVPPAQTRYALTLGSAPANWSQAQGTVLFADGAIMDVATWVGGSAGGAGAELEIALTVDGVTVNGETRIVPVGAEWTEVSVGAAWDLWGGAWTTEEARSEPFGVLARRGGASGEIEIDAIRVIMYHVPYGGIRMLREQVRQQIIIGREEGQNAQQTVSITGNPTGGTFRLAFNGVQTADILRNATAAQLQTALASLSSIGAGNIVANGGPLPGSTIGFQFVGALGNAPQPPIQVAANNLTGGTNPNVVVTVTDVGYRAVGAGAAPDVRLRHARIQPQPSPEYMAHRPAGEKLANHQVIIREAAEGPIEGVPTYDELGWLLAGAIARPNTSVLQAGQAYRHVFAFDNRRRDGIATYQAEYGDQFARAHRVRGMIVNALEIGVRSDGMDLGGSVVAQRIEDGIAMTPGAPTVQTLTVGGTGVFRLRWRGQETSDIDAAAATAAGIQSALRALPGINGSGELVVGGAAPTFTVTFNNAPNGPFLGFPQPLLETRIVSGNPSVSVSMSQRGGYREVAGQVILPRHVELFLSPSLAQLPTAKLVDVFSTGLKIGGRATPVYSLDRSYDSWFDYAESPGIDVSFGLIAQAAAPAMQFLSQARRDQILFLRILATGPLIGATAFPHRMQIDCPVKIANFGPFGENQDVYAVEYELAGCQDDSTNTSLVVTLDNGVANYD